MINEESKGTFKDRDTSRERDRADKRIKDRKIGMKEISGRRNKKQKGTLGRNFKVEN